MSDDGRKIYDRHGDLIGSIHQSRSRRWFTKVGRELSPARYLDAEEAEMALRGDGS